MLERRRAQLAFADGLIAEEVSDLREPWMVRADSVLDDEEIIAAVYQALVNRHPQSRRRGRPGAPAEVVLRLMNYPAWQVEVNGLRVTAEPDHPTGRMVIALPAGRSEVDVRFVRTPDRWVGNALSTLAFIFLLQFWYGERKREFSRKKQLVISN